MTIANDDGEIGGDDDTNHDKDTTCFPTALYNPLPNALYNPLPNPYSLYMKSSCRGFVVKWRRAIARVMTG